MVRVNVGVDPKILTDEHLRAENVELMMLLKFIEKYPKGNVPKKFSLNKGHISFFRNKAFFIFKRLYMVQTEMKRRSMQIKVSCSNIINNHNIPNENLKDYKPTIEDRNIILKRIKERIEKPLRKKTPYRYCGVPVKDSLIMIYEEAMKA